VSPALRRAVARAAGLPSTAFDAAGIFGDGRGAAAAVGAVLALAIREMLLSGWAALESLS